MRAPQLAVLAAGAAALIGFGGCGDGDTATRVVTIQAPANRTTPAVSHRPRTRPVDTAFTACDANIQARRGTTTCPFAQNTFWAYWQSGKRLAFRAWSPALGTSLSVSCDSSAGIVSCTTRDGGEVRFSAEAVASYSRKQADAYATNHDLGPDPEADLARQADTNGEPDPVAPGTDFADPPTDSANEDLDEPQVPDTPGERIPNYDEGDGSRVQCEDGMYSQSGGIQGACSGHGGVR